VAPDRDDALPPVSTTAVGVAMIRAAESARRDRLFEDPLAADFAAASGWDPPAPSPERRARVAALSVWISVRTKFLDDLVRDASASGCRQPPPTRPENPTLRRERAPRSTPGTGRSASADEPDVLRR
jgi:O-methyltransferase involved in polyketide biosynthesis